MSSHRFNVGDRVRVTRDHPCGGPARGKVVTVERVDDGDDFVPYLVAGQWWFRDDELESAAAAGLPATEAAAFDYAAAMREAQGVCPSFITATVEKMRFEIGYADGRRAAHAETQRLRSELDRVSRENAELRAGRLTTATCIPCPSCGAGTRPRYLREGRCVECIPGLLQRAEAAEKRLAALRAESEQAAQPGVEGLRDSPTPPELEKARTGLGHDLGDWAGDYKRAKHVAVSIEALVRAVIDAKAAALTQRPGGESRA